MNAGPDSVSVLVPASTSNCGSGFDTLGLALGLHNRVTVRRTGGDRPEPDRPSDARAHSMVAETAAAYFRSVGRAPSGFRYRIEGDVPPARGLGSSVTVIAGVAAGLDSLHATGLPRRDLIALVSAIEGHPDNAGASILGGFCVSRSDPATGAYVGSQRFDVPPRVVFAVVSPSVEFATRESRGFLPASLPYFDAVRSINGAAYLVAAFASGNFEQLRNVRGDFMHEPYRFPRIPGGRQAMEAGIGAGALTGWLSGSGSSVLCVCERPGAPAVLDAMKAAFAAAAMPSEGRILAADNDGLRVGG
jgi:homoserine kinase